MPGERPNTASSVSGGHGVESDVLVTGLASASEEPGAPQFEGERFGDLQPVVVRGCEVVVHD
jgi:hypothetical protein